eukprot:966326-Prymnesium_polylepis.1
MYVWLCLGRNRSPLLEHGGLSIAEAVSWPQAGPSQPPRINVSVHVRMGDACDQVATTARSPEQSHFGAKGRSCVDPLVYLEPLKVATALFNVDSILLATDSDSAADRLQSEFGARVLLRNFSRRGFQVGGGFDPSKWIERRKDVTPDMVANGLDDMRWLARGHFFIGGMCSHFFIDTWLAASFHQGYFLPYLSLDECTSPRYPSATRGTPTQLAVLRGVSRPLPRVLPDTARSFPGDGRLV